MPDDRVVPPPADDEVPVKTLILLGAVMTVGVALILALTLAVGGGSSTEAKEAISTQPGVVPALSGVRTTEATRLLADRRIAIGGLLQIPSNLPAGQVVRTAPESGAKVAPGESVTLYVSAGGQQGGGTKVIVPFFSGIDLRQAQGVAQELGLTLEVQGTGRIADQSPAPGTEVARGSVVRVSLK